MALIGSALATAVGAGISAWNGQANRDSQERVNDVTWSREDSSIARRVEDLKNAGLSPVLAAGSGASAQQVTAPQLDLSGLSEAIKNSPMNLLSMQKGYADIDATKAGTELSKIQATSELFKQAFVNQQTQNLQSEKAGIDLRNSWINADVSSQLGLRSAQVSKLNKELGQISANTALLQARTAYEQVNKDFLMTKMDNEKILRDMNIINRSWLPYTNMGNYFNSMSSGNMLKTLLGGIGASAGILEHQFPNLSFDKSSKSWYYPKQ